MAPYISISILLSFMFFATCLRAETPGPRQEFEVPQNPYVSARDNNMHGDSYMTDVHQGPGPVGFAGEVKSFKFGKLAGECAGVLFDKKGNVLTVCVRMNRTELVLIDRKTLKEKAAFELPKRKKTLLAIVTGQFKKVFEDTSGGSYFVIDHLNRAIIGTSDRQILVVGQKQEGSEVKFVLEDQIDLSDAVPKSHCPRLRRPVFGDPRCDKVTTVIPDYQGNYWFISRYGKVGVVNRVSREINVHQLSEGEEIQNSFAIGIDGVFIVSDHAMYKFTLSQEKRPVVVWREAYDRGIGKKVGQVNQGSGTSPSLMGEAYVVIADNAHPRFNVLVYRRGELKSGEERLVCKLPAFQEGKSATENSFVVFNNSIIIENNYGYRGPFAKGSSSGGVARVDVLPGGEGCKLVWESDIISPTTVAKLSAANGIIYFYTKEANDRRRKEEWALTGLDFETGEVRTCIPTGSGPKFNNNWGAISLGPDGEAYVGSFRGFLRIKASSK